MSTTQDQSERSFLMGDAALARIQIVEDNLDALTSDLIQTGQLGQHPPQICTGLGDAISLLSQLASCAWGCRKGDHDIEKLVRRFTNYTLGTLRLMFSGLYDEALALCRPMAELTNLLFLFDLDPEALKQWKQATRRQRMNRFGPTPVRIAIENKGRQPLVGREEYASLCEIGIHVSPAALDLSYELEGRQHIGPQFSVSAPQLVLQTLARFVVPCLMISGRLVSAPSDKMQLLAETATRLLQEENGLDVTNYEKYSVKFRWEYVRRKLLEVTSAESGDAEAKEAEAIIEQTYHEFVHELSISGYDEFPNEKYHSKSEAQEALYHRIVDRLGSKVLEKSLKSTTQHLEQLAWAAGARRIAERYQEINQSSQ